MSLDPTVGTEINKSRRCVVVQNDIGNKFSRRTIVVPVTGAEHGVKPYPILVFLAEGESTGKTAAT